MTTSPFIRRVDPSTDESIKVTLNPNVRTYPQKYKDIRFFVCRRVLDDSSSWVAIETMSGSALEYYPMRYGTKKECISQTVEYLSSRGADRVKELVAEGIETSPYRKTMTQDQYLSMDWYIEFIGGYNNVR